MATGATCPIRPFENSVRDAGPSCIASSEWCGRRDSNPHAVKRSDLNRVRLPIPPRPQSLAAAYIGQRGKWLEAGPERGQAAGTNLPPPHGVAGPATARLNFVFSTGHPNKRATAVLTECMSAGVTNEVNGERSMRAALKANRTSGRRANINRPTRVRACGCRTLPRSGSAMPDR